MKRIEIREILARFERSLETQRRIIFSAPFGDGKTYFLKEYERTHKGIIVIKLRPINYSVAPNEDVFEYIKRDILCQLCKQGLITKENVIRIMESLVNKENIKGAASVVLSLIPHIGDVVYRALEIIDNAQEDTKLYYNYMSQFKQQRGGLYEEDAYTEMIREALKESKKKSLLIIDDLDRLDPGHLFRILNVISAHIDDEETENKADSGGDAKTNKFGFTYIVMAMDYNVTEHIFHHFYGEKANYVGYMHKFSVAPPFYYSITDIARAQLKKMLKENIKGIDINRFPCFIKRIDSLKVRECKELMEIKVEERMCTDKYCVNGVNISTLSFPFFLLLVYMNAVEMTEQEVIDDFNPENWQDNIITYIKLMSPLYLKKNKNLKIVSRHEEGVFHEFVKGLTEIKSLSTKVYEDISGTASIFKFDVEKDTLKLLESNLRDFNKIITINDWRRQMK